MAPPMLTVLLALALAAPADTGGAAVPCFGGRTLTVLSWNVYQNRFPARIEAELRRLVEAFDPDVLLLQEAPAYDTSAFERQAVFGGYDVHYAPAHFIDAAQGGGWLRSTGQMVLSRIPFDTTAAHVLPVLRSRTGTPRVRRNAVYARLRLCTGETLGLYNVHLENRALPGGRERQARALLDRIHRQDDDVVVVGGDFNTFLTDLFEDAVDLFEAAGFVNAFPSRWNGWLPRLDFVLVRGARPGPGRGLAARGSDHDPLLVEIALRPAPPAARQGAR